MAKHVYICENCFGPMPMKVKDFEEESLWGNVVCSMCRVFDTKACKPRFPKRALRLAKPGFSS